MPADVDVGIASGRIRGYVSGGIAAFKGVPYGQDVGGRRRWRRASPVTPWEGVRDAAEFGPRAIQPESRDMHTTSAELEALMAQGGPDHDRWLRQSEECLTLNVWTPDVASTRRLPVMVWCHGGKYFGETPPVWWFDGENLAREGEVVVVTVRHRVGVLGFLNLAGLDREWARDRPGNVGLLDLVDALGWVRTNIEAFGGDPDNVTLFGESGGGLKVSVLLAMPEAKGLFHKAIIQSGAQMAAQSPEQSTDGAKALLSDLGLGLEDLDTLLDVEPERLVEAQIRLMPNLFAPPSGKPAAEFEPFVDGVTLSHDSFDAGIFPSSVDVPLLIGTCATETTFFFAAMPGLYEMQAGQMKGMLRGMLGADSERILGVYEAGRPDAGATELLLAVTTDFIFRRKAIRLAEMKAGQNGAPVYMYVLAFETDVHGGKFRTPHILDLPLVFAHPEHPILGDDPARFEVSRQMSGAWAAFARSGDPGTGRLPAWPPYDRDTRATMYFNDPAFIMLDPRAVERTVW